MLAHNESQYFSNLTNELTVRIDALIMSLTSIVDELPADSRAGAERLLRDLKNEREAFRDTFKNQVDSGKDEWIRLKKKIETKWDAFELDVKSYIDIFVLYK